VIVVLPADDVKNPPAELLGFEVTLVAGGRTRTDSVRNGLAALPDRTELVLVHDAARPFVTAGLIDRVIAAASGTAVIPAIRATDTLKEVDEAGEVIATLDRERIWNAQTPQAFPFGALLDAHRRAERRDGSPRTMPGFSSGSAHGYAWSRVIPRTSRSPARSISRSRA
jgi:2-C-methyl-D-erythritol 4-phosphate cytidylyltransferase